MATPEELARRRLASPAYDNNPTLRNAQAAQDAAAQRYALNPASPAYDNNPTLRNAQAAQDAAAQARLTGGMASAMQAQYDQPVYGPRNPPPAQAGVTPTTPPTTRQTAQKGPGTQLLTGVLGLPVAFGRDVVNQLGTRVENTARGLVGAEQVPLPGLANTNRLVGQIEAGAAGVAEQQAALNTTIRNAAGWQPAGSTQTAAATTSTTPTTPTTPTAPPTTQRVGQAPAGAVDPASTLSPENQAVIAQDRANLAAAIPPAGEVGKVPMPAPQGPTYANERGNYSMTGTSPDVIADARRRADTGSGGVNFGFAPGEARSYLDKMAGQDAAKAAQQAERRQAIADDVERIGLRNAMTQGTPQERRAARQALEALDQRAALTMQQTGETTRAGMGLAAELQRAQATAGANVAAAQAAAAGRLQAAQIEGQYGLQAAMAKQESGLTTEMLKQMSPQARKAALEASLLEQQMLLARDYDARGDYAGRDRALGISQPMAPKPIQDVAGNVIGYQTAEGVVPIDPATAAALAKSGQYYLPPKE